MRCAHRRVSECLSQRRKDAEFGVLVGALRAPTGLGLSCAKNPWLRPSGPTQDRGPE
jgi:hypothetical protein